MGPVITRIESMGFSYPLEDIADEERFNIKMEIHVYERTETRCTPTDFQ
jgi:hypothetical protein